MQKHAFERVLSPGIPLAEAAGFFHRIKRAGWGDPPDETGVLEGQFAAPLEQVLAKLLEVTAAKFKMMVAYHVYAESMRGIAQHGVSEVFHEHAEHERAAAEAYLKRAAVLGSGPVHLPEIETPPASSDPVGIAMIMARAEQEAIAAQTELKQMVGEQNPLGFQVEQYMIEDQHHLDELWQMLPQDVQRSPLINQPPAGAALPMPEAAPPVESTAPPPPSAPEKTAGELIQFPGKFERTVRQGKQGAGDLLRSLAGKVDGISPEAKGLLATGALGATLGGVRGGLASMGRTPEEEAEITEKGGPVSHFAQRHPVVSGAVLGGTGLAGALAAMSGAMRSGHHALAIPAGIAAGAAPTAAAGLADYLLKNREAKVAHAFQSALRKLGFQGAVEPGFGTDPGAAPSPTNEPMMVQTPSMDNVGDQPPMDHPPGTSNQLSPVNYLEAEETARRAQETNEAGFYRDKAQEASGQVQSMGQQIQDVQAQLDQLSAQSAESQNQILQANQQAVQANDQMLNQATLAARMRMGMQQLRAQMMEVASQDPEQLAAAAGGPTPMDVGNQAAMAAAGPAAAPATGLNGETQVTGDPNAAPTTPDGAPSAGAPPGSPPGGSGSPDSGSPEPQKGSGESDKKDGAETTVSIKKGSAPTMLSEIKGTLPFMAAGGAIGAGRAYMDAKGGKEIPELQDQVDVLKGEQGEGNFGKSIELAKAQLALGKAQEARANPAKAAVQGGLAGAGLGAGVGMAVPAAISGGKRLMSNWNTYRNLG